MAYVYILKSLKNNRFYIGSTNDIDRRLDEHNRGKSLYTKSVRPFELVYKEEFLLLKDARKREYLIKKKKSRKYIETLINMDRAV
jgi:putative endonuclease